MIRTSSGVLSDKIYHNLRWIIKAPSHLNENVRRFVMLTNGLLLLQMCVGILLLLGIVVTEPAALTLPSFAFFITAVAITSSLLIINRHRAYRWVIWANVIIPTTCIWLVHFTLNIADNRLIFFLLMPMFFASLLLSNKQATLIGLINLVFLVVMQLITTAPFDLTFVAEFIYLLMMICLLAMGSWLVERQNNRVLKSQARLRSLMEANQEILVIFKRDGQIMDVNSAFERTMGWQLEQIQSRKVLSLVHREDRHLVANLDEILRTPIRVNGVPASGRSIPFEVTVYPHEYDGKEAFVLTARNMSDYERIEKERRESERQRFEISLQRERMELLQTFIGDASHHFRTPLANIKTSAYLLERTRGDEKMFDKQINVMRSEIDRIERLIDNLLLMTRLNKLDNSTSSSHSWTIVKLSQLLENIVANQRQLPDACTYHLHLDEDEDLRIMGRYSQLQYAFNHLLLNARTYTNHTPEITLTVTRKANFITIQISDNGIGIIDQDLPHIFDNFYRGKLAYQYDSYASGLGLSIAKRIIELHRGRIRIANRTETHGTTVRVIFPHIEISMEELESLRTVNF